MKTKDYLKDIRSKNIKDLTKLLSEQKKDLVRILVDSGFGKNKNVAKISVLKKSIARIETIINETVTQAATKEHSNG